MIGEVLLAHRSLEIRAPEGRLSSFLCKRLISYSVILPVVSENSNALLRHHLRNV